MTFTEVIQWIVMPVITLICGGGWFINYQAKKVHAEAEGWKGMQDLYQQTINDFKVYSEDMRTERQVLKTENAELRERYKRIDDEMINIKRQLARQGRKLEAISPFLCSVVGCSKRKKVDIGTLPDMNNEDNQDIIDEQNEII